MSQEGRIPLVEVDEEKEGRWKQEEEEEDRDKRRRVEGGGEVTQI